MKECSRSISIQNGGSDVRLRAPPCFLVGEICTATIGYTSAYFSSSRSSRWNSYFTVSFIKIDYDEANCKVWVASRAPARVAICWRVLNGRYTNLSHQKTWRRSKSDVTSAVLNWYWPRTFLHTFATKLSIFYLGLSNGRDIEIHARYGLNFRRCISLM